MGVVANLCQFRQDGDRMRCRVCGYIYPHIADATLLYRQCGQPIPAPPPGLGDYTESLLQSIGVTKERYQAAKQIFGLSPDCSCDARREWLNRVSDWWRSFKR